MISLNDISEFINEKSIIQAQLVSDKINKLNLISKQQMFLDDLEEAAEAIRNIAQMTEEQVKYKISESGTLMLQSVFDDPPEVHVGFEIKNNSTNCVISFKKDKELYSPMEEQGFGICDVAGLGLRFSIWSLPAQRSRKVMILDEIFKHVKGHQANVFAIQALKKISEQLGFQIIIISDERVPFEEIEKGADRVMKVSMINGESKLEIVK